MCKTKPMCRTRLAWSKKDTKDFPCTVSLHYYIQDNALCSEVMSRSTDVYTGLPYDMGFFSLVTELVFATLKKHSYPELRLGHTTMKSIFTQIYDKTREQALSLLGDHTPYDVCDAMPPILNPDILIGDIYNGTSNSEIMKWVCKYANLN